MAIVIAAIVLPAEYTEPIRVREIDPSDMGTYNELVGGYFETVELTEPPATLYVNEEGTLHNLPVNQRATVLLWMHRSAFRGHRLMLGDAFIVGPADDDGNDLPAPDDLVRLLFHTDRYQVRVHRKDADWQTSALIFDEWYIAYLRAIDLAQRRDEIDDIRVVPAT